MNPNLLEVLKGCLNPNTIYASENMLKEMSKNLNFTEQLLLLIPNQQPNLLILVLSTLKNYLMVNYNPPPPQNPIIPAQKALLKENILNLFYVLNNNQQAINVYKQIAYMIILVDYPWPGLDNEIDLDLQNQIAAGLYFLRQVAKAFEWSTQPDEVEKREQYILRYFPKYQDLVQKILSNYNESTAKFLQQILKAFYSAFHIEIPRYLRSIEHFDKWILFAKTVLDAPVANNENNQKIASKIYLKLFATYCNDSQDGKHEFKGWARHFRERYAQGLYEHCLSLICNPQIDQDVTANILSCLHEVVKSEQMRVLLTEKHCELLIYEKLLPLCGSSNEDLQYFVNDPIEYIRREDDLTCHAVRRSAFDLIERICYFCSYGQKSELMKFVEYAAATLQNQATTNTGRQVIIRLLAKLGNVILKNKYLRSQFQMLTLRYFIPLLKINHDLLNSLTCNLLHLYLPYGELSDSTVEELMALIYQKMTNTNSMVVKYNALLAFTSLLEHKAALNAAKPHFQTILEIYVKILQVFDHQNLLTCLEEIVKSFSSEIVVFAADLTSHLLKMFYSFCKNDDNNANEDSFDEDDANNQATAALSTIKQILQCQLPDNLYLSISVQLIELLQGIFNNYQKYLDEILGLFNVLVYRSKVISDFEYPYLACRKLLEGDNTILNSSTLQNSLLVQISKADKADSQFDETLLSILKNLIQKMPYNILIKFPIPLHQELILCIIENKKLSANELGCLNTSQVDKNWELILQSYSFVVYGIGEVSESRNLKILTGLSLFPWIKYKLNKDTLRKCLDIFEEEQEEDEELIEENTLQMLQKYANEEQDDEEEDFYAGEGVNYAYLYSSQFDCTKDKPFLLEQLRNLSNIEATNLFNSLPTKYRKKAEALFSN